MKFKPSVVAVAQPNIFSTMPRVSRFGDVRLRIVLETAASWPRTNMNRRFYSRHKSEDYFLSTARRNGALRLPLRGPVELNRCARSFKLYVVADTHARYLPPQAKVYSRAARASTRTRAVAKEMEEGRRKRRRRRAPRRAFRIKTFVSMGLPLAATSFITSSR